MRRVRTTVRRALLAPTLEVALALGACFEMSKPTPSDPGADSIQAVGPDGKPRLTQAELSALVRGFADRYAEICNQALDDIKAKADTTRARNVAQGRKAFGSASVFAIAARPNPEVALLDMAVQVTVEREIYTRGAAADAFGEHAAILEEAYDRLDADVWALARRVYTEEQLDELRDAIEQWIVDNPNQRYLGFVQLENFARFRQNSALGSVGSPGGLSMLAPINEATRAADEIRLLGERALFLAQRMPSLVEAQAQLLVYDSLGQAEVAEALAGLRAVSTAVEALSKTINDLPEAVRAERASIIADVRIAVAEEREALFAQIESAAANSRSVVADLRAAVDGARPLATDAKDAAAALRDSLATIDRLAASLDPDGPGPQASAASLADANAALKELAALLRDSRAMLESGAWAQRVREVDDAASRRITHIGLWGGGLIVLFFGCLLGYRAISGRMAPRAG